MRINFDVVNIKIVLEDRGGCKLTKGAVVDSKKKGPKMEACGIPERGRDSFH